MKMRFIIFMLIVCLLGPITTLAKKAPSLKKLNQDIQLLQKKLKRSRNQESILNDALKKVEHTVNKQQLLLRKTQQSIKDTHQKIQRLKKEKKQNETQLKRHQHELSHQIRTLYPLGVHHRLKLLLNQEHPQHTQRLLTYYRYLQQNRLKHMRALRDTLETLKQQQDALNQLTQKLEAIKTQQHDQEQELIAQYNYRQFVLTELQTRIQSEQNRLNTLLKNRARLTKIIRSAQKKAARTSSTLLFKKQKGHLPWPVEGRVIQSFGQYLTGTQMKSNGITLAAQQGTPVKAIHNGTVIFADWLRGFGWLVILQHDSHFLSLYAHNQALLVANGETVKTNQPLAKVGQSGGNQSNGLYFEIRRQQKPLDPLQWLKGKK